MLLVLATDELAGQTIDSAFRRAFLGTLGSRGTIGREMWFGGAVEQT